MLQVSEYSDCLSLRKVRLTWNGQRRESALEPRAAVCQLASLIGLSPNRLARHLVFPLSPPVDLTLEGWTVPAACREVLSITDGFNLFGTETWNAFRLWGSQDYDFCVQDGGPIFQQAVNEGLFPIFGLIPHLTSVSLSDGSVRSTDWECYADAQQGWCNVIAPDLFEYLRTVIVVREAYGVEDEFSCNWWDPYASHGTRFDLDAC